MGFDIVRWYAEPKYWKGILIIANVWKWSGYSSIIYLAAMANFDGALYEAATVDGAGKFKQIIHLTLPMLQPTAVVLTLMSIGRIFYGDFGMVYGIVGNNPVIGDAGHHHRHVCVPGHADARLLVLDGHRPVPVRHGSRAGHSGQLGGETDQRRGGIVLMKQTTGDKILSIVAYGFLGLFALVCLYPLVLTLSVSVSSEKEIVRHGYSIIPKGFTLDTYRYMFVNSGEKIFRSYGITILVTILGTLGAMLVTSMISYAISIKTLRYRNVIAFLCNFTIIFSAGLIPWYVVCVNYLKLGNTLSGLIFPSMLSVWNIFLMRTYFSAISPSLYESARIDGANHFRIYWAIAIPLSKTALLTVGLMYALQILERLVERPHVHHGQEAVSAAVLLVFHHFQRVRHQLGPHPVRRRGGHQASCGDGENGGHSGHDRSDPFPVSLCAELFRPGHHGRRRQGMRPVRIGKD